MAKKKSKAKKKKIATLTHSDDKRTNIPTAELESVISEEDKSPSRAGKRPLKKDCEPLMDANERQ